MTGAVDEDIKTGDLNKMNTEQLLAHLLWRIDTFRQGEGFEVAAREFAIAITALEDAQMRFDRGVELVAASALAELEAPEA